MRGGVREKKIVCSPVYQEVDLIPRRAEVRGKNPQGRESSEKQKRANQRDAERHFVQLVNANFVRAGVLLVDLTYVGGAEPADFEQADRNMVNYLRHYGIPFTVAATKADKLSRAEKSRSIPVICRTLAVQPWEIIPFSSEDGTGRDKLLELLDTLLPAPETETPPQGCE